MTDFDWSILERPDAMSMVRGQLGFSWWDLSQRLEGLTDDEWAWEPAPGAWGLRRRSEAEARAHHVTGAGDWVVEWPEHDGGDARTRTIAWQIAHLHEVFFERYEWTFGGHSLRVDDLVYADNASEAVAALGAQVEAWIDGIAALDPEQVFTVGLASSTPIESAAPFGHLVLHVNRELIAHGAEIGVLRDLYAARQ